MHLVIHSGFKQFLVRIVLVISITLVLQTMVLMLEQSHLMFHLMHLIHCIMFAKIIRQWVIQSPLVMWVHKVHKDFKVFKAHKAHKVSREQ